MIVMTDKERLEEISELLAERDKHIKDGDIDYPNYDKFVYMLNDEGHIDWLLKYAEEQAGRAEKNAQDLEDMDRQLVSEQKRVENLENKITALEYASKYNGDLNEFLQKRKLPPNTLGRHVVDVVMYYAQELELQNECYREAIEEALVDSIKDRPITAGKILRKALEESE